MLWRCPARVLSCENLLFLSSRAACRACSACLVSVLRPCNAPSKLLESLLKEIERPHARTLVARALVAVDKACSEPDLSSRAMHGTRPSGGLTPGARPLHHRGRASGRPSRARSLSALTPPWMVHVPGCGLVRRRFLRCAAQGWLSVRVFERASRCARSQHAWRWSSAPRAELAALCRGTRSHRKQQPACAPQLSTGAVRSLPPASPPLHQQRKRAPRSPPGRQCRA